MQSKTSLFNKVLYFRTIMRFWPLWALASFNMALIPIARLINAIRSVNNYNNMYGYNSMSSVSIRNTVSSGQEYYRLLVETVPGVTFFFAVLCAMAVWHYLYTSKSVCMMHSIPLTRKGIFVTEVLAGLTMMMIPWIVGIVVEIPVSFVMGTAFKELLVLFLGILSESIFFFAFATLIAFMTGNIVTMPLLYIAFNFLSAIINTLLDLLASGFCFGVENFEIGILNVLSPLVYLYQSFDVSYFSSKINEPETLTITGNFAIIWIFGAVGILMLVVAWFLYEKRKSESAGDFIAASFLKPVILYMFSVIGAFGGGIIIYYLLGGTDIFNVFGMIVSMLLAGTICYYLIRMMLERTVRVFKLKHFPGLVVIYVICALTCVLLKTDAFGVEKYVPAQSDISVVHLYGGYSVSNNTHLKAGRDDEMISEIIKIQQAIVNERDFYFRDWNNTEEKPENSSVVRLGIVYELKDGTKVDRSYSVCISEDKMKQNGTVDNMLSRLINNPDYLMAATKIGDTDYEIEYASIYLKDNNSRELVDDLSKTKLRTAIGEDIKAGNISPARSFFEEDSCVYYNVEISISFKSRDAEYSWDYYDVILNEKMTNTINALKELGVCGDEDFTVRENYEYVTDYVY